VYSILAAFITASYLVVILIMEKQFQDVFGYRSIITTAVVGFLITLSFIPAKNWIQRFVDHYFFRGSTIELAEQNEQLRREVQRAEKLKAISTLAAGMAHEIKNPLASIKTFVEYIPEKFDDPQFREKFVRITGQEVNKMNNLIQRLLEFARPAPPALEPQKISDLIQETIDFLQGSLLTKHIQVQTVFNGNDSVLVDPNQIKQAFLNILLNSIDAMGKPGRITISTVQVNGHLNIAFSDNGPGISKKNLTRIFDPFFTTKSNGTGLGLSVVHTIIREHGGSVEVESEVGKGTTIRMSLPFAKAMEAVGSNNS